MKTVIDLAPLFVFILIWIGIVLFLRKKRQNSIYILFFTIFYAYLYKVLDYTLFQFQSLIILKHFMPGLMLNGQTAGESVNLVPLASLTTADLKTSLLNILLFVPFGFGLPFVTNLRMKKVVIAGLLLSVCIELLQLVTGLITGITFRIADINDAVFNTIGVVIGYALFVVFVRVYRRTFYDSSVSAGSLSRFIAERPQAGR